MNLDLIFHVFVLGNFAKVLEDWKIKFSNICAYMLKGVYPKDFDKKQRFGIRRYSQLRFAIKGEILY